MDGLTAVCDRSKLPQPETQLSRVSECAAKWLEKNRRTDGLYTDYCFVIRLEADRRRCFDRQRPGLVQMLEKVSKLPEWTHMSHVLFRPGFETLRLQVSELVRRLQGKALDEIKLPEDAKLPGRRCLNPMVTWMHAAVSILPLPSLASVPSRIVCQREKTCTMTL